MYNCTVIMMIMMITCMHHGRAPRGNPLLLTVTSLSAHYCASCPACHLQQVLALSSIAATVYESQLPSAQQLKHDNTNFSLGVNIREHSHNVLRQTMRNKCI